MKTNVGRIDRLVRAFVVAPLAVILAFVIGAGSVGGILLLVVAVVMLGTAAMSSCPLYAVLGLNTCPVKQAKP